MHDEEFKRRIQHVASGCWLWNGAHIPAGYGMLRYCGKKQLAHRVSWKVHNGSIGDDVLVLHKCDVKGCVNPSHLFLGTQSDNMIDLHSKGLANHKGIKNPRALLSEKDVLAIRRSQKTTKQLAAEYKMSYFAIWNIKKLRTWRHL